MRDQFKDFPGMKDQFFGNVVFQPSESNVTWLSEKHEWYFCAMLFLALSKLKFNKTSWYYSSFCRWQLIFESILNFCVDSIDAPSLGTQHQRLDEKLEKKEVEARPAPAAPDRL